MVDCKPTHNSPSKPSLDGEGAVVGYECNLTNAGEVTDSTINTQNHLLASYGNSVNTHHLTQISKCTAFIKKFYPLRPERDIDSQLTTLLVPYCPSALVTSHKEMTVQVLSEGEDLGEGWSASFTPALAPQSSAQAPQFTTHNSQFTTHTLLVPYGPSALVPQPSALLPQFTPERGAA